MKIISNNALQYLGDDWVVRVNLAWMTSYEAALDTLNELTVTDTEVFLDYPQGRTKPPRPLITLDEAIALANQFNVKYFAISNVERLETIYQIRPSLRSNIEVVPKIETALGVERIPEIASAGIHTMQLDSEDLYTDVGKDNEKFLALRDLARTNAKACNVHLLELQGVIFA